MQFKPAKIKDLIQQRKNIPSKQMRFVKGFAWNMKYKTKAI